MATIRGFMAATLDGFIASEDHGLDWLEPYPGGPEYDAFIAGIRTVVMGRKTYDIVRGMSEWPYAAQRAIVVTSTPVDDAPQGVERWSGDIAALVQHVRALDDGDVWIVGGGLLQSKMIAHGALDSLELFVVPEMIGTGIPMFPRRQLRRHVVARSAEVIRDGLVRLVYAFED
ncbi:dihydrofolate reductase family protein [Segnochrobactrum spirostomi]|uniref:Dihydrofolate reductase n=1 Tax=Segnochrobactrum spirostomi TaxID=2608987 RepID=A0A6A7Y0F0_9HYPH|nr:dihydrofolate reductase family protein [Segnochrobactrum spirostomi]MQT12404.1 dihydrofolate reductase [Segnochrobactrum spirostomi]